MLILIFDEPRVSLCPMVEPSTAKADAPVDDSTTISVLVCYSERRRPVAIHSSASFDELLLEIVEVFRDVLPCTSSATVQDMASSLILQVKF